MLRNSTIDRPRRLVFISTGHCTPVESTEKRIVFPPSRLHFYVQVEENPNSEKRFDFFPRKSAHLLEHGAFRPDNDRLLTLALHINGGVDPHDGGRLFPLIDDHRRGVRNLLAS